MQTRKARLLILLGAMVLLPIVLMSSPYAPIFGQGFLLILGLVGLLWVVSLLIKDASIVDIYWGTGYVAIAWFYAYMYVEEWSLVHKVFLAMVTLWGLRLTIYLAFRNIGKGEDYRYVRMREEGGKHFWWISFLRVFLLQGVLQWIISAPFLMIFLTDTPLEIWHYVGIGLFAIGFFFEAVGDWQLTQFKKNPNNKGKILNTGLWKYTRHPNYFGDATLWWGFFCYCLAHPEGLLYAFSPMLMTFLLLKISGVAMLEGDMKKKKPKYADYIARTSTFFPWPPKA